MASNTKAKKNTNKPNETASSTPKKAALATKSVPLADQRTLLQRMTPYLWIAAVCLVTYGQSFFFEFTGLDDSFFLVVYAQYFADIRNFTRGFKESGVLDYYRPILFGSMILDYQVSKTDPWFYHVTNVIYHLGACMVVYRMLELLHFDKTIALISTLIYTAHPLFTMAVAWIPGRNDPMITFMVVGSFNYFLKYIHRGGILNLLLTWFLWGLAIYTKETPTMLPIISGFYILIMTPWQENIRKTMVLGTGWAIIGLIWYAIRAEALELANKNGTRFTYIIYGDSWLKNIQDWPEYIGKFTIPLNLSNFPKFSMYSTTLGLVAIAIWIATLVFLKNRNWRIILFFAIWFFLFFAPLTAFIFADNGRYDYLEHRGHMALVAFVVFLNEIIRAALIQFESGTDLKKYIRFALLGVLFVFIPYTIYYSWSFKNPENFWIKAIEGAPNSSQVYRGMGKVYYDAGELEKAEVNFSKAVELNRAEVNTISDLGKAYENKRDFVSAKRCYDLALKVDSNQVIFLTDKARIYEKMGKGDSALLYYQKVIIRDPNNWQSKFGMGVLYYQQGRFDLSEQLWLDVIRINPSYNDTYMNMAVLYFYAKRYDKSYEYVQQLQAKGVDVASLNPGLVNNLNQILGKK